MPTEDMKTGPATKALLRSLTPSARTLLRHMIGRRFPIDLGTAAEETGLDPNLVNAASSCSSTTGSSTS